MSLLCVNGIYTKKMRKTLAFRKENAYNKASSSNWEITLPRTWFPLVAFLILGKDGREPLRSQCPLP